MKKLSCILHPLSASIVIRLSLLIIIQCLLLIHHHEKKMLLMKQHRRVTSLSLLIMKMKDQTANQNTKSTKTKGPLNIIREEIHKCIKEELTYCLAVSLVMC